jgi:hypothetical protein
MSSEVGQPEWEQRGEMRGNVARKKGATFFNAAPMCCTLSLVAAATIRAARRTTGRRTKIQAAIQLKSINKKIDFYRFCFFQ